MTDDQRPDADELENKVQNLTLGVAGLRSAILDVGTILTQDIDQLKAEVEIQRSLARYSRRTWFEVMAWIFLAGLLLSDLGREYCYSDLGSSQTFPRLCDTVFWTTSHGGGLEWRLLGFMFNVILLVVLGYRSQVPEELYHRVPASWKSEKGEVSWYYRWLKRGKRS